MTSFNSYCFHICNLVTTLLSELHLCPEKLHTLIRNMEIPGSIFFPVSPRNFSSLSTNVYEILHHCPIFNPSSSISRVEQRSSETKISESRGSVIRRNWRKNRGHFINPSRADECNDLVERVRRNTWSSINLKYAVSEGIILDKEPPETCEFGYP